MEYIKKIVSDPDIMLGKPIIKGTRITIEVSFLNFMVIQELF